MTRTDAAGGLVRTMAALADVTERRRSEEQFSKAFALAPIPVMVSMWNISVSSMPMKRSSLNRSS